MGTNDDGGPVAAPSRPAHTGMTPPPVLPPGSPGSDGSPPPTHWGGAGGFDFLPPRTPGSMPGGAPQGFGTPSHGREQQFQGSGVDTKALCDATFASVKASGRLGERDLVNLHLLYSKTLASALGLLDKDLISKCVSESGRAIYLVQGSQQEPYVCFEDFCPCHFFMHKVSISNEALACKHTLAVRLSEAMGRAPAIPVTNEQFSEYLQRQAALPSYNMKSPGSGNKRFKRG